MLSNKQKNTLEIIDSLVENHFNGESTGHDYQHIKRVVNLTSRLIAKEDNAFVPLCIAYFHDVFDDKISPTDNLDKSLRELFIEWNLDLEGNETEIILGVSQIGYRGGYGVRDKIKSAQYVSDADLIDSMGAIGIARTFYYAGSKGTPIYDPNLVGQSYSNFEEYRNVERNAIDHFDEKLLKIIDWVTTPEGIKIAKRRQALMQEYYDQFYLEIEETS
ncbi:phosphohydrolase [Erysipelothrix inopinata]|uniref:Phosphohydrolase n=1 Tax=Erysipelothrix inopinata TaxID=225084 RepID=A0A7G9RZ04_9FIRM|nr:phosphohydrolase [Erysipelothrix inopinata]QNN60829.1 phosphohydrolase [Erysipelothrix inopinata]